jgi:hypothetical protein
MSDFDEVMVLRRIGELVVQGELPPMAHGLLRLLGIAIEQEAALQQAQGERDHLRRALEWLANRKAGAIGAGGGQDFEIDCGQRKGRAKNAEDWAAAALAATEEAPECRYCEGRGAVLGALGEDGDGYEVPCPRCNPLATEWAPDE